MTGTRARPHVCPHARARIKEMGVTDHRVAWVLEAPEVEYGPAWGRRTAQRGDLAVVFETHGTHGVTVVTVLHRTQEQYVRREAVTA